MAPGMMGTGAGSPVQALGSSRGGATSVPVVQPGSPHCPVPVTYRTNSSFHFLSLCCWGPGLLSQSPPTKAPRVASHPNSGQHPPGEGQLLCAHQAPPNLWADQSGSGLQLPHPDRGGQAGAPRELSPALQPAPARQGPQASAAWPQPLVTTSTCPSAWPGRG